MQLSKQAVNTIQLAMEGAAFLFILSLAVFCLNHKDTIPAVIFAVGAVFLFRDFLKTWGIMKKIEMDRASS